MEKTIITGTGRCGSSFLVHLLSALKLDTGYTEQQCFEICQNACQGGAEHTIEKPYSIIKNPNFMIDIEEVIKGNNIKHVIIPIRNLEDTAKSRENNAKNHGGFGGFCWDATNVEEQTLQNAYYLYKMIEVLARHDIPYTTIAFPRMIEDVDYLHSKIEPLYDFSIFDFKEAHKRIANKDKITIK